MNILFHKNFLKRYRKLASGVQDKFDRQLALVYEDRYDARLNNHELQGKYAGYRSINVTGDIRAIFKQVGGADDLLFVDIGTHSELYS